MSELSTAGPLERMLQRDRVIVIAALVAIILVGWVYVLSGAGMGMPAAEMSSLRMAIGLQPATEMGMAGPMAAMATPLDWTASYAILMFFMWWVMMIAMMLPSATPMILLHAAINRKGRGSNASSSVVLGTTTFTFGYLAAWALFSLLAVSLQWGFEATGVLSPAMLNATSMTLAGAILVFAGLYQLTPLKQACLRHCRGPISFLSRNWRDGARGALVMGLHHGAYCLGCCWGLMAVLFFGGIMNLYWIAGLAVIVLLEKTLAVGQRFSLITGGLFVAWGSYVLYRGLTAPVM